MFFNQELGYLFLVQACVGEHADLISYVVPCAWVKDGVPGVFIY